MRAPLRPPDDGCSQPEPRDRRLAYESARGIRRTIDARSDADVQGNEARAMFVVGLAYGSRKRGAGRKNGSPQVILSAHSHSRRALESMAAWGVTVVGAIFRAAGCPVAGGR